MRSILLIFALTVFMGLMSRGSSSKWDARSSPAKQQLAAEAYTISLNAAQVEADKIIIKNFWLQEMPPSQHITAAFMLIENQNQRVISLLSADSEITSAVELHKMELEDGIMKMHKVESIDIPAGGTVELKPGGYHLMMIGVYKKLEEGDEVKLTLRFSNDINKSLNVPVKKRSSMLQEEEGGR